jgi:hypothetical protein
MGMPLKATENAALAATPAASTFQRWRAGRVEDGEDDGEREVEEVMVQRSLRRLKGFENQKIMRYSS